MKPEMRILMTTDTIGGVWSYALELVDELCRQGHHVALATLGAPLSSDQRAQCRLIPNMEVFESRYRLEWMEDPWDDVQRSSEWLLWLADRLHPDIVHLNTYSHGALDWNCPTVVVGHSCVFSWWQAVHAELPPARYATYQRVVRDGLQHAAAVVAPTRSMLNALQRHYGPLPNAEVIHNGIETTEFQPAAKQPFVFGAGRLWDCAKNLGAVARIASALSWPVRLAGDTEGFGQPQIDYGGAHLLGRLSRAALARCYAEAAIFVHPARYEPFGLTPLEAAAGGCALVLGNIDSLREIWGEAARYVDPDDTDHLHATLTDLIERPEARATLAELARQRAQMFGRDAMVRRYLSLYEGLLPTSTPRRQRGFEQVQQARPH